MIYFKIRILGIRLLRTANGPRWSRRHYGSTQRAFRCLLGKVALFPTSFYSTSLPRETIFCRYRQIIIIFSWFSFEHPGCASWAEEKFLLTTRRIFFSTMITTCSHTQYLLTIPLKSASGVNILENTLPWGGGISADVIWGKNLKRQREKGGKCKKKVRKWKENEKRGSKRVK